MLTGFMKVHSSKSLKNIICNKGMIEVLSVVEDRMIELAADLTLRARLWIVRLVIWSIRLLRIIRLRV